jgi:hypothetical protein
MHPASGPAWLVWLETTPVGAAMRTWLWLYPAIEIAHILGFVVLVGAAFLFDLRLLGSARTLPVSGLERHLLRWSRRSAAVVVPSGLLMFVAHATEMAANPAFRIKLLLIAAAALNALVFRLAPFRVVHRWDRDQRAPVTARIAGGLSLVLWTGVIICGRLLAYL